MAQAGMASQAARLAKDLTLTGQSATTIPKLVYGTAWKKDRTADLVYTALKAGFRAVDTAAQPKHYDEPGVAAGVKRAIVQGIITRGNLFIQTKFTAPGGQNQKTPYDVDAPLAEKVNQSVRSSLRNFAIEGEEPYLDSVVLHSPMDTIQDTMTVWKTLESYHPRTIRNIGISNTTLHVLEALYTNMTVKPSVVQNRFHEGTGYETKLRAYCRDKGIVFQSFWTLSANPVLANSAPVKAVARGAGVEVAAAYYALVIGLEGVVVLDGTTSESHMKQDLEGLEKVAVWAEGAGAADWASALTAFKELLGDEG
ncbi:NADP-dependent oxidoreductase domain protein [Metarhizium album ARSEF 1941]|uniref:NADP-dependent oxidoreductase domain protein n=1 Tax=Metarhizium album (strain ARSEF 1941) TaxID=1081103 RepID=A0A0B2X6H0_METAS|nr:NADP-dependent oxidoreductase domain protein [Metarhizium album ARSEF 1941]KHO01989.1 NADP-dependent oxidoreductase domain protein [Metarhizium album ARSEF 1941]